MIKSFLILLLALPAYGAAPNPLYFSESGSGSQSGADASDCEPRSFVTAWSGIPDGTTLILIGLCGYTSIQGNNITLLIPPGSGISQPAYYGVGVQNNLHNILINGMAPAGGLGGGFIANTANGSGLANQSAYHGVYCTGGISGLWIMNIAITNIYVHSSISDDSPGPDSTFGVYAPESSGSNFFGGIYFSNCGTAIGIYGNNFTTVSNCNFQNCNHGLYLSTTPGSTTNWAINCTFGSCSNWDTTDNTFHNDSILWDCASGQIAEWRLLGCIFNGDMGANNSGQVLWQNNPPLYGLVTGNLFYVPPGEYLNDGCCTMNGQGMTIVNNTFIGGGNTACLTTTANGPIIGNNLFINSGGFITFVGAFTSAVMFNNLYANFTSYEGSSQWHINSSYYTTLAAVEAVTGETGSQLIASTLTLVNTNLIGAGTLPAGSAAIGAGNTAATIDGVVGWPPGGPIDIGENRYFVPGENYGAQFTHP
jgi:hypothetical protein